MFGHKTTIKPTTIVQSKTSEIRWTKRTTFLARESVGDSTGSFMPAVAIGCGLNESSETVVVFAVGIGWWRGRRTDTTNAQLPSMTILPRILVESMT